jgi:hypothetical protein
MQSDRTNNLPRSAYAIMAVSTSIIFAPNITLAECLWADREDLKQKFEHFILGHVPNTCEWYLGDRKFGYQAAFVNEDRKIIYEIRVPVDAQCFVKLSNSLKSMEKKNKLVQCGSKRAYKINIFKGANSIMFYFNASEEDIQEVGRQTG